MQALPQPGPDELGYLQLTAEGAVLAVSGGKEGEEGGVLAVSVVGVLSSFN